MSDRPLVARVIAWLRAGYPHGVPEHDYVPLLAILRRQLSEDEVKHVSSELINEAATAPEPISTIDAGVKITKVTHELPHQDDVTRVQKFLEEHGFPFNDAPLPAPDPHSTRSDGDKPVEDDNTQTDDQPEDQP